MTKEEIYSKLEYNGKYDTKVKTELRKLIKENKDNSEAHSLLLEIQNELETGKAKISFGKTKKKEESETSNEENDELTIKEEKKAYIKKEKKNKKKLTDKKKKKKKKISVGAIIGRIFVILMVLLMIASSISTIFSYFG